MKSDLGFTIAPEVCQDMGLPSLLTPDEVAARINISRKFIITHAERGDFPGAVKCGYRTWRFSPVEIEKRLLTGKLLLDT